MSEENTEYYKGVDPGVEKENKSFEQAKEEELASEILTKQIEKLKTEVSKRKSIETELRRQIDELKLECKNLYRKYIEILK